MNISFFGASITQQKTGYVHSFKELNPTYNIQQFGYGGMYITDAGICFIDDVIYQKPDYCFIDWFSPACYRPPEKIEEYLDAIVEKLLNINCHVIFLFFYRKQMDPGWFQMFDYLKKYANQYNIVCYDLSNLSDPDQYLRDNIHTNSLGSEKYGKIINNNFHSTIFTKNRAIPKKNKYSTILNINTNIVATKYIKLISLGQSSIIGVLQKIGLYTEDVSYVYNNEKHLISLKDKWSLQYERSTIKISINNFCEEIIIQIPEGKQLIWEKLFYTGDRIQITDYE